MAQSSDSEFEFIKGDISNKRLIDSLFDKYNLDIVVNLAAQAGARYSIENPDAYITSNIIGFYNILEACCHKEITYVDDIVEGVMRVMQKPPEKKVGEDGLPLPPYMVYNIGNANPENLLDFVDILQQELIRAKVLPEDYDFDSHKELVAMQPGDVPITYVDTSALERDFGFKPKTDLRTGLRKFAEWYKEYYG